MLVVICLTTSFVCHLLALIFGIKLQRARAREVEKFERTIRLLEADNECLQRSCGYSRDNANQLAIALKRENRRLLDAEQKLSQLSDILKGTDDEPEAANP